jgi:hypothetical protein
MKRRVAVADRYQPYAGSRTKMKVPCHMARTSYMELVLSRYMLLFSRTSSRMSL